MKRLKILYVDGTIDTRSVLGGAVEGMRLLIKDLNPSEFEPFACVTFPSLRTKIYSTAGAEIVTRAHSCESLIYCKLLFRIRGGRCIIKYFLARRLSKIIKDLKPDVLHINLLQKWDYFDLKSARRLGVKTVGHMRSLGNQSTLRTRDIAECDAVVCVSKCVEEAIRSIHPGANTNLIYNGIDPNHYITDCSIVDARHALSLPIDRDYYVFSVGSLHPRKGHDTAIRALAEIRKYGLDAILGVVGATTIAGDHQEQSRLSYIATQVGVSEHVFFLGQIHEIKLVYRAANLVYALSHDGEAFGRVPIEAAFCRVPVIASRVGATPEIIQEDITGLLVEPEDIHDITKKTIMVLTNAECARRLVERAEEYAGSNFSSVICTQRTAELYTKLFV